LLREPKKEGDLLSGAPMNNSAQCEKREPEGPLSQNKRL